MDQILRTENSFLIFQILSSSVLILCIFLLLKYEIKKRTLGKVIPSRSIAFIDILGISPTFPFHQKRVSGYPLTAYILQFLLSFCNLFKNESIFLAWIVYAPFIVLNKPEAVEEALSGTKVNEKSWIYNWLHCWLGTGLLTSYGQKWRSRRRLLTPAFHFDILKDFLPVINEKSMILVKKLEKEINSDYTNIVQPITLCSLDIICETTLGVNIKAQENSESEYVKAVARVSDSLTNRIVNVLSWFDFTYFLTGGREIKKDLALLHGFTLSIIKEKKKELMNKSQENNTKLKRKPLLEVLLEHHIETNELTEEDIREEVDTFTFEGHDTTSMAMTWALYLIGLYKDVQSKVHEELDQIFGDDCERPITTEDLKDMKYLDCVLKESLRLYPSVPLMARKVDKDMNICGYPVPKGVSLLILPYHLHRNEDVFPNPEVFDPNRFTPENSANRHPYAYIPFSAGSRNCIGQRFAVMEEKTVVANILRNFTLESLDPRDKVVTCVEIILRPSTKVRVQFRPRQIEKKSN